MFTPYRITAVVHCRFEAPRVRNSTASRQVCIPPIADMGMVSLESLAISAIKRSAIGRQAGPEKPLIEENPWMLG